MLKILVVEKLEARRADYVDAICELPGVVVSGAASGLREALRMLSAAPVNAVIAGLLPEAELAQLSTLVRHLAGSDVIVVADTRELLARVESLLAERRKPDEVDDWRAARTEALALARAGGPALAHRLRVAQQPRRSPTARGLQTIVLKDWLPAVCAHFATMMPAYVELVPIISSDTPPVLCVPEVLEREMLDLVLEAATKLPWGGTIWLTTELVSSDTVRIDVLENGLGTGDDVTLRTAAPVSS